jgi:hypothetical protein
MYDVILKGPVHFVRAYLIDVSEMFLSNVPGSTFSRATRPSIKFAKSYSL